MLGMLLVRGFPRISNKTRCFSDAFNAHFEEEAEVAVPKRPKSSRQHGGASQYLEDVTNSQLRKMGPVKRTQALFDSPTEIVATRDRGARFRVDYSILDESLHAELGVLDEIIKDGRKEREETRQRHLRRAQKEKEMRARQGQGIREIKQPMQNSETFESTPTSAVTKPDRSTPAAAPISGRAEDKGGAGSECQDEQDQQDEQSEDMSPEILSPRQLLARVRLVRPPSVGPVPLDPAEIVEHIIDLSRRTEDQKDREKLSRLLVQLEPELLRLTPGQCASLLLALPQPLPHWTSKLLSRLTRQANALNTHTLVTLLLGLARLQKLADEDDAQVTAIKEVMSLEVVQQLQVLRMRRL